MKDWPQQFASSSDPERTLIEHLGLALNGALETTSDWSPGEPFRLLLAGYSGAGNVGTEMRTGEIVRQVRFLLGAEQVRFTALSLGSSLPQDVLADVQCLRLASGYMPTLIGQATREHHGTIACEGSMLKSGFANVLSAIMAAALGMAERRGMLSVGYGAEVASMDPILEDFVKKAVRESLVLCRNEPSRVAAERLGLRALPGVDTAWTFDAAKPEAAHVLLRSMGWNGEAPLLTICPMNPFWWPVRPSLRMAAELRRNRTHKDLHYASIFFHTWSPETDLAYQTYIAQLASAVRVLCREMDAFPIFVAMDKVDRRACVDLAVAVGGSPAIIVGNKHEVGVVVAMLRLSALLVSSRFHALVAAMPAGTRSVGIAMDERIRNLFDQSDDADRVIAADDPELSAKVLRVARTLDRGVVLESSRVALHKAIKGIGLMGQAFVAEMQRLNPAFPVPNRASRWEAFVPPLSKTLQGSIS